MTNIVLRERLHKGIADDLPIKQTFDDWADFLREQAADMDHTGKGNEDADCIMQSAQRSEEQMSRHRVEDKEDLAEAEENTVVDQLPTVAHSAEDAEEACPRQVGRVGMRPQQRVETIRAVEEPHATSEARETSAGAAPRTSYA